MEDNEDLVRRVHRAALRFVHVHHIRSAVAADLAQEALLRLVEHRQRKVCIRHPVAWCWTVFRTIAREARDGRADGPIPPRPPNLPDPPPSPFHGPEEAAAIAEMAELGAFLLDRLPPPYRQIAYLQTLAGSTRREIGGYLRNWRAIGEQEARRLIRATHEMLPSLVTQGGPEAVYPFRYLPSRNPWIGLDPPPLLLDRFLPL